jgi:hypothetical protein
LVFRTSRDLLGKDGSPTGLWELSAPLGILRRQREDGSWRYKGGRGIRAQTNYDQIETFRQLGELVEKHCFTKEHTAIRKAADFLLSFQTEEGDIRGIYGNQYTPNYTAAMMELLEKAGYKDDPRIDRALRWLLSVRQDDGGWAIPLRTTGLDLREGLARGEPIPPVRSKPSSYMVTGVVLRAFAAHPEYREHAAADVAGRLALSYLFKRDVYPDRQAERFWTSFSFPFWFTDLLSLLDSLTLMGFTLEIDGVKNGHDWLVRAQGPDGLWNVKLLRDRDEELKLWISWAICRVVKRLHSA